MRLKVISEQEAIFLKMIVNNVTIENLILMEASYGF
jgi:hypothetical protein